MSVCNSAVILCRAACGGITIYCSLCHSIGHFLSVIETRQARISDGIGIISVVDYCRLRSLDSR